MTNKFTVQNSEVEIDTNDFTNILVPIRDLSEKEFNLCGLCDNKTWITDSVIIFGVSFPYDADSKLLSDGTWYDSNGNHGFWWFNDDESMLTYDYDSTSSNGGRSTVDAVLVELTDTSFVGEMEMLGMPATYYMSAVYDTVELSLSVRDTTLYLDNNGQASLAPGDLMIDSAAYCFTCTYSLSRSVFDINDLGDNEVYVNMEDRCGNLAVDTMTVTIAQTVIGVDEITRPEIRIYPNPATDIVFIESPHQKISAVDLLDITGKTAGHYRGNKARYSIRVSDFSPGLYFLRISTPKGVVLKKIIVE